MRIRHAALVAAVGALFAANAHAIEPGPVFSPHVDEGEWELEARGFTIVDKKNDENGLWNYHFELGYGVNAFWFTEIGIEYEKLRGAPGVWEAYEWENRFQFTEPGQYWIDIGGFVELEKAVHGNGKEALIGLLFEKDIDDTTLTLNWLFGRTWDVEDASSKWEQQYRAQWRWRRAPAFEPLLELQADEHAMNAGPGFTGTIKLGGTQKLNYTTAWLFRATGDTPQNLWRFQLEYEF